MNVGRWSPPCACTDALQSVHLFPACARCSPVRRRPRCRSCSASGPGSRPPPCARGRNAPRTHGLDHAERREWIHEARGPFGRRRALRKTRHWLALMVRTARTRATENRDGLPHQCRPGPRNPCAPPRPHLRYRPAATGPRVPSSTSWRTVGCSPRRSDRRGHRKPSP